MSLDTLRERREEKCSRFAHTRFGASLLSSSLALLSSARDKALLFSRVLSRALSREKRFVVAQRARVSAKRNTREAKREMQEIWRMSSLAREIRRFSSLAFSHARFRERRDSANAKRDMQEIWCMSSLAREKRFGASLLSSSLALLLSSAIQQ